MNPETKDFPSANAAFRAAMRAYSLAEVLVVIVVLALVLGPLLAATGVVAKMQHRTGERARRESWRSIQDQALVAGIDPSRAPGFRPTSHSAIPSVAPAVVERLATAAVAGRVGLRTLRSFPGTEVGRVGGAGWELVAGAPLPAAGPAAMPALPIILEPPTVTPASGTRIPVASLAPAASDSPATFPVLAVASAGLRVRLVAGAGGQSSTGGGRALVQATALELVNGFRGLAWSEYPGTGAAGEVSESLPDGRIRWAVTESDGRTRVYEPSAVVAFELGIDVGAPVLVWGSTEISAGTTVSVDYPAYCEVRKGTVGTWVAWPKAVRDLLGADSAAVLPALAYSFQGAPGNGDGNLAAFFAPEQLVLWSRENTVVATPLAPGACRASGGIWTLRRETVALDAPELISYPTLRASVYEGGAFEFAVPERSGLGRIGRVSAQSAALMSSGPSLSLTLSP